MTLTYEYLWSVAKGTTFSAGSDITEFRAQRLGDAHVHYDEVEHRATEALASCRVPVVAVIRGACRGGGPSASHWPPTCATQPATLCSLSHLGVSESATR
ncbi:MAG: hypothetical protein Ct9H300mP12_15150 [Acidimicrobiales bacterium]|nr:MAG: hypothetical protein Ct9H300mP12_15150 [Acidimicrobiales bacterium]